jgi:ABC-2 type transport system ATP-binding protein
MARLTLDNAGVEFALPVRLGEFASRTRRRLLGGTIDHQRRTIRALDGIMLDVREGDRLGIVGHNGAGKTTLLRVLAGIYVPTTGTACIEGRISTLINTLPGLDPDDTGLGNIKTCALFYQMSSNELKRKIDDIVAYTELGEYLDLPVRVYSSGMLTRLSFAIATAIEPEVLILDEGLSTGDAAFAAKAETRITDLISRSAIVVFASHSTGMLKGICTTAVALEKGRMVAHGPIGEVVETYFERLVRGAEQGDQSQLDAAYVAAQDLVSRGERVPLEVEEQALRAGLQRLPGDLQMQLRLVQVMRARGADIPPELEIVELEEAMRHTADPGRLAPRLEALRARVAAGGNGKGRA